MSNEALTIMRFEWWSQHIDRICGRREAMDRLFYPEHDRLIIDQQLAHALVRYYEACDDMRKCGIPMH